MPFIAPQNLFVHQKLQKIVLFILSIDSIMNSDFAEIVGLVEINLSTVGIEKLNSSSN
jgi:hypothetical protein